jgi:hypothetical protein
VTAEPWVDAGARGATTTATMRQDGSRHFPRHWALQPPGLRRCRLVTSLWDAKTNRNFPFQTVIVKGG